MARRSTKPAVMADALEHGGRPMTLRECMDAEDGGAEALGVQAYKSLPVGVLQPYEKNARTHDEAQVEQIQASIREFGYTNPILIDEDNRILAGHGRLLAVKALGWPTVPTLLIPGLTDAQKRALTIADNKLALNAGWDLDVLRLELKELGDLGYDLGVIGFSPDELQDLMEPPGLGGNPDNAPPLGTVATSVLGDVWILGPHKLYVGDATTQGAYDALLGTERVDICWTDPPYNVDYLGAAGKIKNDDLTDADFLTFLNDLFVGVYAAIKPGGAVYVAHADAGATGVSFRTAFLGAGFKLAACLIWKKDSLVLGRSDYQWIHEPILYGWRPGSAHRWYGGRKNTSVIDLGDGSPFKPLGDGRWSLEVGGKLMIVSGEATVETLVPSLIEEPRPRSSTEHPTMKPVGLIERQLKHNARVGDLVLDPCAGSGSTLIAADRLGMSARVIELDPLYADVIIRRWQAHSGRQALHGGTAAPFGE